MMASKADLPAINWFVDALVNDVGHCEWKDGRVIKHPILPGNTIVLEQGKYTIACNSDYTKSFITELAWHYKEMEKEYVRLVREEYADKWHPASEPPLHKYSSSSSANCLVATTLAKVVIATYDNFEKKWLLEDGVGEVTHWRHLPPLPVLSNLS